MRPGRVGKVYGAIRPGGGGSLPTWQIDTQSWEEKLTSKFRNSLKVVTKLLKVVLKLFKVVLKMSRSCLAD